jgi:predicted RNA-binding Zn ribbon-like protein
MDFAWLDLLNSDCNDYLGRGGREDRLGKPEWLGRYLGRWRVRGPQARSPETVEALRGLRATIRAMVDRVLEGKRLTREQWNSLNSVLGSARVHRRIEMKGGRYEVKLMPAEEGIDGILADIAASFAQVFVAGDPSRIKLCENPDCRWVIYDRSKNRSRRWCEGSTGCGNLMKVRRHRARKRGDNPGGP